VVYRLFPSPTRRKPMTPRNPHTGRPFHDDDATIAADFEVA
jgi:hypothetical protein